MFVYWKLGRICVWDDVSRVSKALRSKSSCITSLQLLLMFVFSLCLLFGISALLGYRKNRAYIAAEEILSYSFPLRGRAV